MCLAPICHFYAPMKYILHTKMCCRSPLACVVTVPGIEIYISTSFVHLKWNKIAKKIAYGPGPWCNGLAPHVRRIYLSPVDSHHKGQWRGVLMFSLTCAWTNGWAKTRDASDLRLHGAHYDAIVMMEKCSQKKLSSVTYKSHRACSAHDNIIKGKHFPRYWFFVRGIHRSPLNFPHKGQWRGALKFSLICAWINGWVNTREAGDMKRHRTHYDIIVIYKSHSASWWTWIGKPQHWQTFNT